MLLAQAFDRFAAAARVGFLPDLVVSELTWGTWPSLLSTFDGLAAGTRVVLYPATPSSGLGSLKRGARTLLAPAFDGLAAVGRVSAFPQCARCLGLGSV
jgi:hypothetical protein